MHKTIIKFIIINIIAAISWLPPCTFLICHAKYINNLLLHDDAAGLKKAKRVEILLALLRVMTLIDMCPKQAVRFTISGKLANLWDMMIGKDVEYTSAGSLGTYCSLKFAFSPHRLISYCIVSFY